MSKETLSLDKQHSWQKKPPYTATFEEIQQAHAEESIFMVCNQRGILIDMVLELQQQLRDQQIEITAYRDWIEQCGVPHGGILDDD